MEGKEKSTFAEIFDPRFKFLVFPRIVRVLFVISMVLIGLYCIFLIAIAFAENPVLGILVLLIGAPVAFILGVLWVRLWFEYLLVIFRIEERLGEVEKGVVQLAKEEEQKPEE